MKEIFNFRRFGKYLWTDIKTGYMSYGISLLSLGLAGIAVNIVVLIFNTMIGDYCAWDSGTRAVLFFLCGFFATVMIPVKRYGIITDRRKGAEFLLCPASTFEKFVSMILVSVIVIPVFYSVIFLGMDALWGACDKTYDMSVFKYIFGDSWVALNINEKPIPLFTADDLANIILTFLLGGMVFRKSKIGKTFLVILGIGVVLSIVTIKVIGSMDFDINTLSISDLVLADNISDTAVLLLLLTGIYFRMRKIQL